MFRLGAPAGFRAQGPESQGLGFLHIDRFYRGLRFIWHSGKNSFFLVAGFGSRALSTVDDINPALL